MTDVSFTSDDGNRLAGSVALPEQAGHGAGVVLVGGSGPSDRHNGGLFDDVRDALAAHGLTVLAYDKRGVGGSTGHWASAGVDVLAADARAAVDCLRGRLAGRPVGLFGHSEGGWVALRAAVGAGQADFLVLNSCPTLSFLQSEVYALSRAGVEPEAARALFDELSSLALSGASPTQARRALVDHEGGSLASAIRASQFEMTDAAWTQFTAWFSYDPLPDLAALTVPTLAVYGGADELTPVPESVAQLKRVANNAVQSITFRAADHRLRVDGEYAVGYLSNVANWCRAIAK